MGYRDLTTDKFKPTFSPFVNIELSLDEDECEIYENALGAYRVTKASTGFNLFTSPRFIEHLTIKLLNVEPTSHSHRVDGIDNHGLQYEIKFCAMPKWGMHYTFSQVRKDKGADFYVFVGHDQIAHKGDYMLDFFIYTPDMLYDWSKTRSVTPKRYARRATDDRYMEVPVGFLRSGIQELIKFDHMLGHTETEEGDIA